MTEKCCGLGKIERTSHGLRCKGCGTVWLPQPRYSQAQVNWLLMRAYKAGWRDAESELLHEDHWFSPSAEKSWRVSNVLRWMCDKARRSKTTGNRSSQ